MLSACAVWALSAEAALAQTNFKMDAQPAPEGIRQFARQAGVQILVQSDAAQGKRTAPVRGSLPIDRALQQLLTGTGLTVVSNDGKTIILAPPRSGLIRTGWATTAAGVTPPAPEPAPPEPDTPSVIEEVIVTGTRSTSRTVTESMAPIDVISAAELTKSGKQSTRDLISTLVPSANTSNSGAGASFAIKTVSLRGLSADQTLVLVNGKRRHNTAILFVNGTTQNGQSPPDLDLIPSASIERIEVLRDGASAQYGSDALAGVINVILKKSPEGGSMTALYGKTAEGDGETGQFSGNFGMQLGQEGYLNLTADIRITDPTDRGDKTLNTTQMYFPLNALGQPVRVGTAGATLDPREATANRHTSHPGSPQVQLFSLGYSAGSPLGDKVDLYSFGTFSSRNTAAWLTFRNPNASNNITAIFPDGYTPRLFLKDRDFQVAFGAKGTEFLGFNWDLSTTFSRDDVDYYTSSLNASLGPASPTYFYLGTLKFQEWTSNLDLTREVDTGAFADPLFVAVGAEYRDDKFEIVAGEPASYINGGYVAPASSPQAGVVFAGGSQGVTGFPPFSAGAFSRDNISAYLNVEQKVTEKLELALAGRFEHYSDFGNAKTFKLSSRYAILPGLAIRGTASTGFRAPSLQQQHYASSSTIGVIVPPATTTQLYPVQLLPPDNPAAIALGAKPLRPEKSVNYSVGLVAQPISRMNVTLDVYQIKIDNRILQSGTLGPNTAVSTALASQGLNPQQAAFYYGNFADTKTRGIDFVVDYRTDFGDFGNVHWTFSANHTKNKFTRVVQPPAALAAAGIVYIDRVKIGDLTVGTPKEKYILGADWTLKKFNTNLRLTRYGEVIQRTALAANDETVSPKLIVDLDLSYAVSDNVSVSVGANNLLDAYPDSVRAANRGTPAFAYYNQYAPYGISGGFYYVRMAAKF
ncbi:TonB-dependent receptor [Caulobacter sp.]|uniref:TonB-dependent receptor n=1 Tax=Caulobacter sp. TaxID=78 RepID=UPI0025BF38C1|nr:TonB-dependent receptor [Caulobacter sp.]